MRTTLTTGRQQINALPNSRKIWTVLPTIDYRGNWNNFTEANALIINEQFEILGAEVGDYHNDTPTSSTILELLDAVTPVIVELPFKMVIQMI